MMILDSAQEQDPVDPVGPIDLDPVPDPDPDMNRTTHTRPRLSNVKFDINIDITAPGAGAPYRTRWNDVARSCTRLHEVARGCTKYVVPAASTQTHRTHLAPVDALAAGPVVPLKVASLDHEPGDDAVERGGLVAEAFWEGLAGGFLRVSGGWGGEKGMRGKGREGEVTGYGPPRSGHWRGGRTKGIRGGEAIRGGAVAGRRTLVCGQGYESR